MFHLCEYIYMYSNAHTCLVSCCSKCQRVNVGLYTIREELERFTSTGNLTLLHVSFSRLHPEPPQGDEDQIKYVQDNMRVHWRELAKWVMEDEAVVYVCG